MKMKKNYLSWILSNQVIVFYLTLENIQHNNTKEHTVTLAMHVAPPDGLNRIVASSFGRIGKTADADDRRVIAEGAVLREVTDGGARLAVELPLLDRHRRVIGALSTSFRVRAGADPQSALPGALLVRDTLARKIESLERLVADR